MEDQRHTIKKDIARRIKILHIIFIGVVAYFLFHIIFLTFFDKELSQDFEKLRDKFILVPQKVLAHRGTIYSRDKEVLATSITRTTVRIDYGCDRFRQMGLKEYKKEASVLAQTLADCLGEKRANEYYNELVANNKKFITYNTTVEKTKTRSWIFFEEERIDTVHSATLNKDAGTRSLRLFRDVDANEWEIIKNVPLLKNGQTYTTEEHDYRVYPQGDLAMRTIGRLEHHKAYGIEEAFRDTLAAHDGRQLTQRITNRFRTRVEDEDNVEARDGYDVVTTLDVNVQDVAHSALSEQLKAFDAMWGTTIVMECATGDILAMANLKNEGKHCKEEQNYAIGIPVNPGSTFKLISAMALLENGVPSSKTYDAALGRRVLVGNNTKAFIQDSHPIGRDTKGVIDMRTAFAESSNVYFTKAIYEQFKKNPQEYSDFCHKIIPNKVGLEEFGARSKVLAHLGKKHPSRYNALVNYAYGYGLELTPLHTITVYNAVANNGRMVAPRLILRTERNGQVINHAPIKVLNEKICSQKTLDTLRSFMVNTSQNGTAKRSFNKKVCPFSSGSKTGTAQVESTINGVSYKKADGYKYCSMVTFFPAENPRYTIMTAIFAKEKDKEIGGANVAGPVQKRVATYLYNRDRNYAHEVTDSKYFASDIKGGNIAKMQSVASAYGVAATADTPNGWGTGKVSKNKEQIHISTHGISESIVPNVVGMGLDDALFLLENCGLIVEVKGFGKVVTQSIAPNTFIEKGKKRITITLE